MPLAFHWHGSVSAHVDKRNGPGEFGEGGFIHRIRYRWDTPSTTGATVQWRLDDTVAFTHSVTSDDPYVEVPAHPYAQEAIVAVVTAVGSDGAGLSAFVYLA